MEALYCDLSDVHDPHVWTGYIGEHICRGVLKKDYSHEDLVMQERKMHELRGYTLEHDIKHGADRLLRLALKYANNGQYVKAGSLIMAARDVLAYKEKEESMPKDAPKGLYWSKQCSYVKSHAPHKYEVQSYGPFGHSTYYHCNGIEPFEDLIYVTAVLASTQKEGKKFAEAIGLTEYRVITKNEQAQGLRIRAFVITPGYIEKVEQSRYETLEVFDALLQASVRNDVPFG